MKDIEARGTIALFSQIAYKVCGLPADAANNLAHINNMARIQADSSHILTTVPSTEISTKNDGIHFTDECAYRVWDRLVAEVNNYKYPLKKLSKSILHKEKNNPNPNILNLSDLTLSVTVTSFPCDLNIFRASFKLAKIDIETALN